jgi:VanZ family protein
MVSQRPDIEPASNFVAPVTGRASARPAPIVKVALALGAAIVIVGGSPLVGALRQALLIHWPAGYIPVLAACVVLPALGILALSARSAMRAHVVTPQWSAARLAAIGLAFGVAIAVGYSERTGDPNVDVVEAFHFVEFGALTCLFVWAAAPLVPRHAWVWGAAASIVVAALDEWTQWFVPNRTGEIRDVGIDAVATLCGVLLVMALQIGGRPDTRRLVRPAALAAAVTLVAVATCFAVIHLGSIVLDADAGRFRTRFSGPELLDFSHDRAACWGSGPIPEPGLFAREDQYLSEALWHVRRRNRAAEASDTVTAWREERILETYFAPILRVATPARSRGHAFSTEQLATIEAGRAGAADGESDASPIPIFAWSKPVFWTAVAGAVGMLGIVAALGGPGHS